jgi:glycosyltransferase involved in cell wall biosynthesis
MSFNVSVVMPSYNAGPWISTALSSVAAQTRLPLEVVVVDDGSTDDTVERIVASGVATKLLRTDRLNAAGARNAGIDAAAGDWIAFLDADDWWLPEHLDLAVSQLTQAADCAYMCHFETIRPGDGKLASVPCPVDRPLSGLTHDVFMAWLARKPYFNHQGLVVRRDVLIEAGGYDTTQIRRHDFEMFMRVIHGRTWSFNPTVGSVYRSGRPGNLSGDRVDCAYFFLRALIKNEERYRGLAMVRLIHLAARNALGAARRMGDAERYDRAWRLARGRLRVHELLYYGFSNPDFKPFSRHLFGR